ncbi:MAG TPA: helix-turn-helix domain-containing protein [Tenuifilaceae bacterium]|nr:helix-turn-helix domain-containing protein [Tenuifilaceae bacterium]HPE18824.1 helix-turn-helix domain-containing protein [Tenuifilaceae bacterium]HPJ46290.1 helix-turn-helix domain-containing protein [Tenuifilaceae bacterium]HPQ34664.1 helix-turn-helix domain-containing protein [Tenuifilaceae bacterium]HRX68088.1 helix-turn-helix domain-containing protein [Tenuifilaceae bacterium]
MNYIQYLGDIIKYHRKKAGLSQKSLADIAGVGKTVVFDIEKGKETVQFKSIISVLKVLNISLELNSPLMEKYNKENENS